MEDEGKSLQGMKIEADDHDPGLRSRSRPGPEEEEGGDALTPRERLDLLVLDIARLIGRRIARDEFERQRAASENDDDNVPHNATEGEGEAIKD